jgi:AmmeMemoRadiSam system protein B/AmmeMemoRadiSam system protein A
MKNSIDVRKPSAAGSFYPSNPVELSKMLAQFFAETKKQVIPGRPIAIIAPHAGYIYSGRTAAAAFKLLEGENYDTVVIISPSHTVFFQGASVYDGDGYQTPIGVVEIDEAVSASIANIHPSVYLSNKGHTGGSVRGEHALEVQLPFLQLVLGKFKLVAIVIGEQEEPTCRVLGEVLASALQGRNCLIVASTDLSHFHPEKEARKLDSSIQKAVEEFNPEKLLMALSTGRGEACGGGPTAAALMAAKRLGGEEVVITGYTTSGETTGEFDEVVGYLSAVVVSNKVAPKQNGIIGSTAKKVILEFNDEDKEELRNLAMDSIKSGINNEQFTPTEPQSKILRERRGAFVTIKIGGMLRGCIGMIRGAQPLYLTISEMAQAAAFEDRRFMPITEKELKDIEIEISVLSPLIRVESIDEIKVGRDGLMILLNQHSGLLLPQVAAEHGWDKITFLEQTCLKAGLSKNSFKDKSAEIYRFSAEIF